MAVDRRAAGTNPPGGVIFPSHCVSWKKDTDHTRDNDRLDAGADTDTVRGGGGSDTMLDDASEVDENFAYWAEWGDAV